MVGIWNRSNLEFLAISIQPEKTRVTLLLPPLFSSILADFGLIFCCIFNGLENRAESASNRQHK
jgi:hypothetical protein